jgi:hypothetical protein
MKFYAVTPFALTRGERGSRLDALTMIAGSEG